MIAKDYSAIIFVSALFIVGLFIFFVSILFSVDPYSAKGAAYIVAVLLVVIGLFLLFFMRDPERKIGDGIVSPADGKVTIVDRQGKFKRVAVFMNPLNVHVNRVPISGEVVETDHHPGGFKPAYNKESESNERYTTVLKTGIGNVEVVQIAGIAVRRIIPYLEKGDKVKKGDRLGHIMFGSRVDTYLPKKANIVVEEGQKVKAGITTIAESKKSKR
jgi:phosphatidylserine decarboxylase